MNIEKAIQIAGTLIIAIFFIWVYFSFTNYLNDAQIEQQRQETEYARHMNEIMAQQREAVRLDAICIAQGTNYSAAFDMTKDYDYSCHKIQYINDHFVDQVTKEDAGYVSGSYSGFLSRGHIDGKMYQYVVTHIAATGQLVENLSYTVDCHNQTRNEIINYYTPSRLVMYYVNNCIENESKVN